MIRPMETADPGWPPRPPFDPYEVWPLNPEVAFLNHGSFGACPRAVLQLQQELRQRMEAQPVAFLARDCPDLLQKVREELGRFIGARAEDLALIRNATAGVNAVLRSLRFSPGDELLTTNHGYNACRNALRYAAENAGATAVIVDIPLPIHSAAEVVARVLEKVTERTRLVLVDHVSSATAIVFPLAELVGELNRRGVDVLVDGAHAPGMVPLDIGKLGAAYYTGNCHKWLCAPKGAAFLHVRPDRQRAIHPLSISHGASATVSADRSRFRAEFDWTGTEDPTPWLCIPECIRLLGVLLPDGGWAALMDHNRALAVAARRVLCAALGTEPLCPESMLGSMATVRLPRDADGAVELVQDVLPLQARLMERFRIEVPVFPWPAPPRQMLRLSAQVYNHPEDYVRLASALKECM
jgi:isopenicillin-N epimerase